MSFHLAQINIGRLLAPLDDPQIAGFVSELDSINALADAAPGFVWRLQSNEGNATYFRPYPEDDRILLNMSVWETIEALGSYVYASRHIEVFRQRAKWFEKMEKPNYCLWWIPAGHIPTVAEGRERLEHYQILGATPYSFWFHKQFPAPVAEPVPH